MLLLLSDDILLLLSKCYITVAVKMIYSIYKMIYYSLEDIKPTSKFVVEIEI